MRTFVARRPVRGASALALALALSLPAAVQALTPVWQQGLTWTISTAYRKLPAGKKLPGEPARKVEWSEPTNWVFYVAQVEPFQGGFHYLVQVKDREHKSSALASLVFGSHESKEGGTVLSLLRGKYLRMIRGRRIVAERTDNEFGDSPRPVLHELSHIPYDFPAFPLVDPAAKPRERNFEVTEESPPFRFAKDILQREETGLEPSTIAGDDIRKKSGFRKTPADQMVFVTLTRTLDGAQVRQVWAPGLPWALYSDNGESRSVLIYHSKELSGPKR